MPPLYLILVLAVVQGITEFLPISSDGHLVVTSAIYEAATGEKVSEALAVEIMLHTGTLAAVLVVFRSHLLRLVAADRRVIGLLAVGTVPGLAGGYLLKKLADSVLVDPLIAGIGLVVSGILLIWAQRHARGTKDYVDLTYRDAFIIGLFQAAAPLPGVSRSGTTISSGVAICGLSPKAAADFSFLLSVPIISAAIGYQSLKLYLEPAPSINWNYLTIGVAVSFIVGIGAIQFLLMLLRRGRLIDFAWWVIPLGIGVVIWQLLV